MQGVEITAALERVDLHDVTTADVQALFNAYSNNSSAARQQNADQRIQNERKLRTDSEHLIKQSLSVVAQACNEPFSMNNSAQSSVTSITRAVTTMANEHDSFKKLIHRTKADIDALIRLLLLPEDNGMHPALQEPELRVKFRALNPLIKDYVQDIQNSIAVGVSQDLHHALEPLKLAPFVNDGNLKRSIQAFISQVSKHLTTQNESEQTIRELVDLHGGMVEMCNNFLTRLAHEKDEPRPNLPLLVLDPSCNTREVALKWHTDFQNNFEELVTDKLSRRDRNQQHLACERIGPRLRNLACTVRLEIGLLKSRLVDNDTSDLLHVRDSDSLHFLIANIASMREWIEEAMRLVNAGLLDYMRNAKNVAQEMRQVKDVKWEYRQLKVVYQREFQRLTGMLSEAEKEKETLEQVVRAFWR